MKFFDLDSPLMQFLSKMADLLWLNIITLICCIPVFTIGPALTAMHYMSLKMVRNEECYITRGFLKSFKENFRQGTLIWLLLLLIAAVLGGDFYIMRNADMKFSQVIQIIITAAGVLGLFTATFVFPVLAKFENTIVRTLKNALIMSILQFPKTIAMIVLGIVAPVALFIFVPPAAPVVFVFGLSLPSYVSAMMYNKFFKKLEDQMEAANAPDGEIVDEASEDDRIFKDELDESLLGKDNQN